jgi:DNA-binding PadR family transcriptional regulator
MPTVVPELDLADWATLALIGEGERHGWAIVRAMRPAGEVGRVWACSRARVYRAIDTLADERLVEVGGAAPGASGPARRSVSPTDAGRGALAEWLATPVAHVRDVRSALLLKLLFIHRAGADPAGLLAAQQDVLAPIEAGLAEGLDAAEGYDRTLLQWRLESCRAARRFVESLLADPALALGR